MFKIIVPNGGRSNLGLIKPILKRLDQNPNFDVFHIYFNTEVGDFNKSYQYSKHVLSRGGADYDLMLCVGDRVEITAAAAAAFHQGIPIAHVYAGTVGDHNMLDAVNRHVITLWSKIQFCESGQAAQHVRALKSAAGLKSNIHIVGCTHMDDVIIPDSSTHQDPYDLVLYNPLSNADEATVLSELNELAKILNPLKHILWIGPNNDINSECVRTELMKLSVEFNIQVTNNLPRSSFLKRLKYCDRFIGNSSSMFYEAPYFLKKNQIIHIGTRNAGRETITKYGASDKIVQILEEHFTIRGVQG